MTSQIDTLKSAYESMGYTDVVIEYGEGEIDGTTVDALMISAKLAGQDFMAISFTYKKGPNLVAVCLSAFSEAEMETLVNSITLH